MRETFSNGTFERSTCLLLMLGSLRVGKFDISSSSLQKPSVTFADVIGDAADLAVDHLLVELLDVEGLDGEGQRSGQHGEGAHAPVWVTKRNAGGENVKSGLLKEMRSDRLHRPDVHFGSVLPVSQKFRGCVGGTAALGAEEFRGQRLSLQRVAQAKVCAKHP